MKKIVCILALTCVVMGGAFAQAKAAAPAAPAPAAPAAAAKAPEPAANQGKNSIALDVFPLFEGIIASGAYSVEDVVTFTAFCFSTAFERSLVPHFSIGGDLDIFFMNNDYDAKGVDDLPGLYFGLAGEARYYPLANFDKFFLGTTLGFNSLSVDGKKAAKDKAGFSGLIVSLKTGYKVSMGKLMYVEPSLSYVISDNNPAVFDVEPAGWKGRLRVGVTF